MFNFLTPSYIIMLCVWCLYYKCTHCFTSYTSSCFSHSTQLSANYILSTNTSGKNCSVYIINQTKKIVSVLYNAFIENTNWTAIVAVSDEAAYALPVSCVSCICDNSGFCSLIILDVTSGPINTVLTKSEGAKKSCRHTTNPDRPPLSHDIIICFKSITSTGKNRLTYTSTASELTSCVTCRHNLYVLSALFTSIKKELSSL